MNLLKDAHEFIVNSIIRAPRHQYQAFDLISPHFAYGGKRFQRRQLSITNDRGQKLECSHYLSAARIDQFEKGEDASHPCVVYLHGKSSCQLEALDAVFLLLPLGVSVFAFDFSGSGRSEGDYTSLGFFEKKDVSSVVNYLRSQARLVSTVGLWGRSMGAAAAVMYTSGDPSVAGVVLDSPFSSLIDLSKEMVANQTKSLGLNITIPKVVLKMGIKNVRKSIQTRAGFDIKKLNTKEFAKTCFSPAIFIHGLDDQLINIHHSEDIMAAYAGESSLIKVEGGHTDRRPKSCSDSISLFFQHTLIDATGGLSNEPAENPDDQNIYLETNADLLSNNFDAGIPDREEQEQIEQAIAESLKGYQ